MNVYVYEFDLKIKLYAQGDDLNSIYGFNDTPTFWIRLQCDHFHHVFGSQNVLTFLNMAQPVAVWLVVNAKHY